MQVADIMWYMDGDCEIKCGTRQYGLSVRKLNSCPLISCATTLGCMTYIFLDNQCLGAPHFFFLVIYAAPPPPLPRCL